MPEASPVPGLLSLMSQSMPFDLYLFVQINQEDPQ